MTERRAEGASELRFGDNDVLYSRSISGIIRAADYILRGTAKRGGAIGKELQVGGGVAHVATCPTSLIWNAIARKSRKGHSIEASIRLELRGSARGSHTLTRTSLVSEPGYGRGEQNAYNNGEAVGSCDLHADGWNNVGVWTEPGRA